MKNVLLVFGGSSYEHDVSIVTASQIFNKTMIDDIKLVPLYVSKKNHFYLYNSKNFNIKDFIDFKDKSKKFKEVKFISAEYEKLFEKTRFGLKEILSVKDAIIACHGGFGENGELVSFLDKFGISSSSGSFSALNICMNKFIFKQVMRGIKVPIVAGFKISKIDYENEFERIKIKIKLLKFPVIIKANSGGSSIGLFVAKNREEFNLKLKDAFEFDDEVLIEKYIESTREFNVAIVGSLSKYKVSEIDEPIKENEILTFADKYLSCGGKKCGKKSMASSLRKFPADICDSLKEKIKFYAEKIFVNLNLSGVVRIDFLYDEKNDKIYVCEVNAVPGSLAYYFFEENRISCNDLVLNLLDVCEKNKLTKQVLKQEYFTNILG